MTGPVLTTERLVLRPLAAIDLEAMVSVVAHDETRRYLGKAQAKHSDQFERLLRNGGSWHFYGYGGFAVRPRGSDELIAFAGVFHSWRDHGTLVRDVPEAGWIVRHDWTGKGIAREAMDAVFTWFDEAFPARRTVCMIEDGNAASQHLAARLGFSEFAREALEDEGVELVFYERGGG